MKFLKIFMRVASVILLLLILAIAAFLWMGLPIATGYSAKIACSCVFLDGRTLESVQQDELSIMQGAVNYKVDEKAQTVETSVFGAAKQKALFREGFGCSLLHGNLNEEAEAATIAPTYKPDTLPFPMGEQTPDSIPAWIDLAKIEAAFDKAFSEPHPDKRRNTRATLVIYDTLLIAERYAEGFDEDSRQAGWSMTKSVTNALIGILVKQGKLDIHKAAPVPEWQDESDPRHQITIDQLLRMSSGLKFSEQYFTPSDATNMLFRESSAGGYSASLPLENQPDSVWVYASGTSNILARMVRQTVGDENYWSFPRKELFDKLGMFSTVLEPDEDGTFVGSSFMHATPRDWARFGMLYLQNGVWQGEQILPEGWATYSANPTPKSTKGCYAAHFWANGGINSKPENRPFPTLAGDLYYLSGFEGQTVAIIPSKKLVIVRMGQTLNRSAFDREEFMREVIEAFEGGRE